MRKKNILEILILTVKTPEYKIMEFPDNFDSPSIFVILSFFILSSSPILHPG